MKYEIPVIPYPHTVSLTQGSGNYSMAFSAPEALQETAQMLARQAARLTGLAPGPLPGIHLQADASLPEEGYVLRIAETITLAASAYPGFCRGLATLLRMGKQTEDGLQLPWGEIQDAPDYAFRGIMVDLARGWHPMPQVLSYLDVCFRLKLNILHLHFTDDQLYTLPSHAYPQLSTPGASYTWEEIALLNRRAKELGICILPEIDLPGHAGSFLRAYPEVFGTHPFSDRALCMGRESVYKAVDTLITEVCEMFPDADKIHIGGDEVADAGWRTCTDTKAYMQAHNIPTVEALYSHAVGRMARMVLAKGRRPVVWEGFPPEGAAAIPQETLVMPFECAYHQPDALAKSGYQLVNAAWKPLYITDDIFWPWTDVYDGWQINEWYNWVRFSKAYGKGVTLDDASCILGAQIYCWHNDYQKEWQPLIRNAIALSERLWYAAAPFDCEEFRERILPEEQKLLLHKV